MDLFQKQLGAVIDVELNGDKWHTGVLVDAEHDILVVYNGERYIYIPTYHVLNVSLSNQKSSTDFSAPPEKPINNDKQISYRKILLNSKGIFSEIFVCGNQPIHGYITHVMTNYFEFYSPVYRTMFIPLVHLKWLTPYNNYHTPYLLDKKFFPVNPSDLPLSRTFEEQIKKLEGNIVVFDLGRNSSRIGLLKAIENNIVHLITAEGRAHYTNIQHIKSVHSPSL
ncbi:MULTISPECIES: DUF2642 domain-containing protein [Paenibacillus]|uniref:DUF2642 domain-containing protein n=1 Tax=Paenibacillus violae TaxID=3077234 RepID=A0ABU3RB03_9BACL|nr:MULTISPECIES: DUF2642 domain-containing protein [Paenibacillus]MDU0201430.1 DUF2642 domain-containing protein [Paenibacillus sp. PFR10]MEC0269337.1 DUF2642 domain-containing protein [Paenibacillus anseongense]